MSRLSTCKRSCLTYKPIWRHWSSRAHRRRRPYHPQRPCPFPSPTFHRRHSLLLLILQLSSTPSCNKLGLFNNRNKSSTSNSARVQEASPRVPATEAAAAAAAATSKRWLGSSSAATTTGPPVANRLPPQSDWWCQIPGEVYEYWNQCCSFQGICFLTWDQGSKLICL